MATDRHEDVVGHEQSAQEVEAAAQRTQDVVGKHGRDGFGEGVDQEALIVVLAPHQALLDAGYPHDSRVNDDADRGEPEVPADHADRIEPLTTPKARDHEVDSTEGDQAVPAKSAGMHMAN